MTKINCPKKVVQVQAAHTIRNRERRLKSKAGKRMLTLSANGSCARFTASWRMLRIVLINVQHGRGSPSSDSRKAETALCIMSPRSPRECKKARKSAPRIFWLRDDSLTDSDNLPPPEVIENLNGRGAEKA